MIFKCNEFKNIMYPTIIDPGILIHIFKCFEIYFSVILLITSLSLRYNKKYVVPPADPVIKNNDAFARLL